MNDNIEATTNQAVRLFPFRPDNALRDQIATTIGPGLRWFENPVIRFFKQRHDSRDYIDDVLQ